MDVPPSADTNRVYAGAVRGRLAAAVALRLGSDGPDVRRDARHCTKRRLTDRRSAHFDEEGSLAEMTVTGFDEPGVAEGLGPDFRLVVTTGPGGALVVPQGELDLAAAPQLEAALSAQTGPVVLDLRELTFVDAAGLRVLVEAEAHSRQDGMNLRFIAGEAVRRLFELAAVPDALTYVEADAT
jgi:anti-sigma B factor antagonist